MHAQQCQRSPRGIWEAGHSNQRVPAVALHAAVHSGSWCFAVLTVRFDSTWAVCDVHTKHGMHQHLVCMMPAGLQHDALCVCW